MRSKIVSVKKVSESEEVASAIKSFVAGNSIPLANLMKYGIEVETVEIVRKKKQIKQIEK